ncbi:hypothetical protein OU789_11000 [Halocynthiibacter sp. C4]|uniref:hypothetical protein n=1 Tax=Halocynthiibacter sp. C4 TaxID=2992758 RepID=UPI00237A96D6|nr:hypothetical protein [Halocynthiibacter sp. C4]MDE0590455.1 hypothetical protein [Halocynthiibacter sp. C4]
MGKIHGLTEAEISRVIRAAKKEGCHAVEVVKGKSRVIVPLKVTFPGTETKGEASEWDEAIVRASNLST